MCCVIMVAWRLVSVALRLETKGLVLGLGLDLCLGRCLGLGLVYWAWIPYVIWCLCLGLASFARIHCVI